MGPPRRTENRRLANRYIGALYMAGSGLGFTSLVIPHGPSFNAIAATISAIVTLLVGIFIWNMRPIGIKGVYALLTFANTVVAAGVASGQGDEVSLSAAVLFVWLALAAGLFLPQHGVLIEVCWSAFLYAAALIFTGNAGAPAEWLFVIGTATVAAVVTTRNQSELQRLAATDTLTGLPNKETLYQVLDAEIAKAQRTEIPLTVAVADIDDFKAVNDQLGHMAGDQALVHMAGMWRSALRATDMVFRFGGDEFVFVMAKTSEQQAQQILDRLRTVPSRYLWSAGLAEWRDMETSQELLERADQALYREKFHKKNRASGERQRLA